MRYVKYLCLMNSFLFFHGALTAMETGKFEGAYFKDFRPIENSYIAYTSDDEKGKVDDNFAKMVMKHCPSKLQSTINYYKQLVAEQGTALPHEKNRKSEIEWCPILLIGPTGCGKTSLAKVLAAHMGVPYTCVATPALPTEVEGEAVKRLQNIFEDKFNAKQPQVLIFDELSGLTHRYKNNNNPDDGLVEKFSELIEQSKTFNRQKVLVIATICARARIPSFLLEDFMISRIPLPDFEQRKSLVNFYVPTAGDLPLKELEKFLKQLQGRTPREIKDLFEDAMLAAADRSRALHKLENKSGVTMADLYTSLKDFREIEGKIMPHHPMLSSCFHTVGPHMRWIIPMAITLYCTVKFKEAPIQNGLSWFWMRGIFDTVLKDIK